MYPKIKTTAKDILHHTNGKASKEINFPKMAVKPQIKTVKWSIIKFFLWS